MATLLKRHEVNITDKIQLVTFLYLCCPLATLFKEHDVNIPDNVQLVTFLQLLPHGNSSQHDVNIPDTVQLVTFFLTFAVPWQNFST